MSTIGGWIDDELVSWALASVVTDLCARCGMEPTSIDAGSLEGRVRGYMVSQKNTALAGISSLAEGHLFDMSSWGGRLFFYSRGGDPVATIPLDDMIGTKDIDKRTRQDSISVPLVMHLQYQSPNGELDPITQTSERSIDSRAVSEESTESPDIITDEEAAQRVEIAHKLMIEAQRGEFEFELSRKWLALVVGDVIMVDGERLRITSVSIDTNSQKYKAAFDRKSAYSSDAVGVPFPPAAPPEDRTITNSVVEFLDLPLLDDDDDDLHIIFAAERTSAFWNGVDVEVSTDGGASYFDEFGTSRDAVIGYLTEPMAAHESGVWDENSVAYVKLVDPRDTFEPYSRQQALNRQGMICIGNEVASYTNAEETNTPGVWELSGFIRGRKGTTGQAWPADTRVVLLDSATYETIGLQLYDLNRTFTARVTTLGSDDTPEMMSYQPTGRAQVERAPAKLMARRSGSDLIVSWIGVGKLGGGFQVAMGQHFTGYRVTLGANVYNTQEMTLTIPYAAGTLRVQQINSLTGPGAAAELTV